jgi:hypothetical protein
VDDRSILESVRIADLPDGGKGEPQHRFAIIEAAQARHGRRRNGQCLRGRRHECEAEPSRDPVDVHGDLRARAARTDRPRGRVTVLRPVPCITAIALRLCAGRRHASSDGPRRRLAAAGRAQAPQVESELVRAAAAAQPDGATRAAPKVPSPGAFW